MNQVPYASAASRTSSSAMSKFDGFLEQAIADLDAGDQEKAFTKLDQASKLAPRWRLGECHSLRGYCFLKQEAFAQAEEECTKAINAGCRDAQTYAWRAAARAEQNRWDLAFEDLDTAVDVASIDRDTYVDLLQTWLESAETWFGELDKAGSTTPDILAEHGWVYLYAGRNTRAEPKFLAAIEAEPGHPWASTGLAKWNLGNQQQVRRMERHRIRAQRRGNRDPENEKANPFDGVIELCSAGADSEKASVHCQSIALAIRARLYREIGKLDRCERDIDRLKAIAGDDISQKMAICRLRYRMGDWMTAVTMLSQLLERSPHFPEAVSLRARCYARVKLYNLAIDDFEHAIELQEKMNLSAGHLRSELAEMLIATHQISRASVEFEKANLESENSFASRLGLAKVFLLKKRLDLALSQCQKAITIDSSQADAFATEARIYLALGDYTRATDSYNRAVRLERDPSEKSQFLYLRGVLHHQNGEFENAARDFRRACRLRPYHAGAWVWKSASLAAMESWAKSLDCLDRAIAIRPSSALHYQKLGVPIARKAVRFYDRQILAGHESARVYRDRATARRFIHQYTSAIDDLTWAIESEPDDPRTHIELGRTCAMAEKLDAAEGHFNDALRLDRRSDLARFHRAHVRLAKGNFEGARRDIQKAIRINAVEARYHNLHARIFVQLGEPWQSIRCFGRSILIDPANAETYRSRGQMHLQLQHWLRGIADLTRSIELDPSQTELLVERGHAYMQTEKKKAAIADFELALTRDPLRVPAYTGRASVIASMDREDYAIAWLTKALHRFKKSRDLAELVFARGRIYSSIGFDQAAADDFSTVLHLCQNHPDMQAPTIHLRGIARLNNGDQEGALRDFRAAVEQDPNNASAQSAIGWLENPDAGEMPDFLRSAEVTKRLRRPPQIRSKVVMTTPEKDWRAERPFNSWIVRSLDKTEYGPVDRKVLNRWIEEGRIDFGMRLLRADWGKWQRAEKIFKELLPEHQTVERGKPIFPTMDLTDD